MHNLLALVAGVAIALGAQFGLDALADSSQLGHWGQHGLLFVGGLSVGTSLVQLYRAAARQPA